MADFAETRIRIDVYHHFERPIKIELVEPKRKAVSVGLVPQKPQPQPIGEY